MKYIDITPTWSAVLPIYLAVMENPNASSIARGEALKELNRMAKQADAYREKVQFEKELNK